jgi:hypothetical protein
MKFFFQNFRFSLFHSSDLPLTKLTMPVRTRAQARRPRRSALIIGSDYRGPYQPRSNYLVQRGLSEQRIFAEQNVTVLTDELPGGVFYDPDLRTTRIIERMIVNHLMTLVRGDFSTPGDKVSIMILIEYFRVRKVIYF